jgi:FkbM family methyltransferase
MIQYKDTKSGILLEVAEPYIYEEAVAPLVDLPQCDVVVDIGANAGSVGLFAAWKWGADVYAVEPFGVDRLLRNFAANDFEHLLTVLPFAIHTQSGQRIMFRRAGSDGQVGACFAEDVPPCRSLPLTISPKLLRRLLPPKIDLLKIDIEAHEHVLGAELQHLLRGTSMVHLEEHRIHHPLNGTIQPHNFTALFKEHGFEKRGEIWYSRAVFP